MGLYSKEKLEMGFKCVIHTFQKVNLILLAVIRPMEIRCEFDPQALGLPMWSF